MVPLDQRQQSNQRYLMLWFHLVYGADAVLPQEIYLELAWVTYFNEEDQAEARELDSNLLEESLKCYYNKSVVSRELDIGGRHVHCSGHSRTRGLRARKSR
jgi:hypothetical protein